MASYLLYLNVKSNLKDSLQVQPDNLYHFVVQSNTTQIKPKEQRFETTDDLQLKFPEEKKK